MPEDVRTESIGSRIRRLRLAKGLSQREIASPGVSYAYISRIEAGARTPSVKALRRLARKLEVSVEYLETGRELGDAGARELRIGNAELRLRLDEPTQEVEQEIEAILAEAREAGDQETATRALAALGLAAARRGRSFDAVNRLEAALAEQPISPVARPDVYATLAQSYVALGAAAKAVTLLERCLSESSELVPDDVNTQVRYATYLSFALTDAGDYEGARRLVKETLQRAGPDPEPFTRVRLYWSLARLSGIEGRSAQALDYVRRAIALLEATEDTLDLARAHMMAAGIEATEGETEAAREHAARAERLLGPAAEKADLGMLRIAQARVEEDPARSVALAREAVDLLGRYHGGEQGSALLALAEGLARQGDVTAADESYHRAIDLLAVHGRRVEAASACADWAEMLRAAGRAEEADAALERARVLSPAQVS